MGVQDTDMGDWDWDARDLRLKQVAGTRTGICRDTGDQDQGVGDQERDTTRLGYRDRCMERWGWQLRGPEEPAPGEPGHRTSGQEYRELGQEHRSAGTSTGTWSNQDTGDQDQEQGIRNKKLGTGQVFRGTRIGTQEIKGRTGTLGLGHGGPRHGYGGQWQGHGRLGQGHEGCGGILRHH